MNETLQKPNENRPKCKTRDVCKTEITAREEGVARDGNQAWDCSLHSLYSTRLALRGFVGTRPSVEPFSTLDGGNGFCNVSGFVQLVFRRLIAFFKSGFGFWLARGLRGGSPLSKAVFAASCICSSLLFS